MSAITLAFQGEPEPARRVRAEGFGEEARRHLEKAHAIAKEGIGFIQEREFASAAVLEMLLQRHVELVLVYGRIAEQTFARCQATIDAVGAGREASRLLSEYRQLAAAALSKRSR